MSKYSSNNTASYKSETRINWLKHARVIKPGRLNKMREREREIVFQKISYLEK